MRKFRKVALWIGGTIVVLMVLILVFVLLIFGKWPTHDKALLKAINAESRILMTKKMMATATWSEEVNHDFGGGSIAVAKSQWPRAIASLSPQLVIVQRGSGVNILTNPFFDGGWGYWVQPGRRKPPEPAGRYEYLGEDVYWFHPY